VGRRSHIHALFVCLPIALAAGLAEAADPPRLVLEETYGPWEPGYAEGPIEEARFNRPQGMDAAPNVTLYIADTFNHCLRALDLTDRTVSTLLGVCGEAGREAPAEDAIDRDDVRMRYPTDVAWDARRGVVYVADAGNGRVLALSDSGVTEITGQPGDEPGKSETLVEPMGLGVDENSRLFIADRGAHAVYEYVSDGVLTRVAGGVGAGYDSKLREARQARFDAPHDVTVLAYSASRAAVFVADTDNGLIRWLQPGSVAPWLVSNYAGSDAPAVWRDAPGAAQLYRFDRPYRLLVAGPASAPVLYIAEPAKKRLIGVTAERRLFIAAGDGAPTEAADMGAPHAIAATSSRVVYVFDDRDRLLKFSIQSE